MLTPMHQDSYRESRDLRTIFHEDSGHAEEEEAGHADLVLVPNVVSQYSSIKSVPVMVIIFF